MDTIWTKREKAKREKRKRERERERERERRHIKNEWRRPMIRKGVGK